MATRSLLTGSARQASSALRSNASRSLLSGKFYSKTSSSIIVPASRQSITLRQFQTSSICFREAPKDAQWASKGDASYDEVKKLSSQPTGEVTIIDVREPDEVAAGMIPSAVNVPLTKFENAFNKNGGANFQQEFSFPRPGFDDKVIFYCRSGKRSAQAQDIARKNGWQK